MATQPPLPLPAPPAQQQQLLLKQKDILDEEGLMASPEVVQERLCFVPK